MIKIRVGNGAKYKRATKGRPIYQVFINKRWDQVTANCEL